MNEKLQKRIGEILSPNFVSTPWGLEFYPKGIDKE